MPTHTHLHFIYVSAIRIPMSFYLVLGLIFGMLGVLFVDLLNKMGVPSGFVICAGVLAVSLLVLRMLGVDPAALRRRAR